MNKQFQKKIEDFECENCGEKITGDGYTNHCPICLWSKHVDVNPGDRASRCGGLMEPFEIEKIGQEISITHKCIKCGYKKKNKSSEDDDYNEILEIIG